MSVLQDVCSLVSAIFRASHRNVLCATNTAKVKKAASICFLEVKFNRRAYMRRIIEAREVIGEMKWPIQKQSYKHC